MKTPEEIKKGLAICVNDNFGCNERCSYFGGESNGIDCASDMHEDALAYIQQLESRLAQVERERDAAVDDITEMLETSDCEVRHVYCSRSTATFECNTDECKGYARWRGVCEENTKEGENDS